MDDATLVATRRSLHAVAELVLAGPQYDSHRTIRLRVVPDGFAPVAGPDLRVDGVELVSPDRRLDIAGHSCAELADASGVAVRALCDLYADATTVDPTEILQLDPAATAWLARCWSAGDAALQRLYPAARPILWPEHFDVGIRVRETNYGVSPGDATIGEPYAYVGPSTPPPGAFWNQPFGAARLMRDLDDASPDAVF